VGVRAYSQGDGFLFTAPLIIAVVAPSFTRLGVDGVDPVPGQPAFRLTGWAYHSDGTAPCGIAKVSLQAIPVAGGVTISLGDVHTSIERPDAAATIGRTGAFPCGWSLTFPAPPPGAYYIYARAYATVGLGPFFVQDASITADLTRGPFGYVDTPATGATVAGAIGITGWALDDGSVDRVAVFIDDSGAWIGDATFVQGARPDVAAAYPAAPNSARAGWGIQVLSNLLPGGGNGPLRFRVVAYDNSGRTTTLAVREVTGNNSSSTLPFGTIDLPAQGATVSGVVAVFGWALTPAPHIIPLDGSTVEMLVDGVVVGRPFFGQCRGTNGTNLPPPGTCNDDIAQTFGLGFRNLSEGRGAIGSYLLDTTTLTNGLHEIVWRVTDSNGAVQGIGGRLIYVRNPSAVAVSGG
jgi:hypothetical protein